MTIKPVIALHLGVHKTATTYIQSRLYNSQSTLREAGIAYIPMEVLRPLVTRKLSTQDFNGIELAELLIEKSADCQRIILSDENILGDKLPRGNRIYPDAKLRLNKLLNALAGYPVEAFITLRSYPDYLVSRYVEFLRHWDFVAFDRFYRDIELATVSWRDLVDDIRDAGIARLHVRDYNSGFADEQEFFDQLLEVPNFPLQPADVSSAVRRARISQQGYDVVQFFARNYSVHSASRVLDVVDNFPQETTSTPFTPLPEQQCAKLEARYRTELADLLAAPLSSVGESAKHKFIFIAGLHRSGTSLLHQIMREHPHISGIVNAGVPQDEGQHLQSVYKAGKEFGGPGRFVFHAEAYMDESHPLATVDNAERLFGQWSRYYDLACEYLIEKSPPNIVRSRFLQKLFPDSHFIVLLRHPIAVAHATRKWSKTSIASLLDHTLRAYELFARDHRHLHRVRVVRYEEFVARPKETLDAIYDWLGLEPVAHTHEIDPQVNQGYFERWQAEQQSAAAIAVPELEKLEQRARCFGYSLIELDTLLPVTAFNVPPGDLSIPSGRPVC